MLYCCIRKGRWVYDFKWSKELLSANGITFELQEFQNEAAYFQHLTLSYTKKTRPDKVIALIIKSKNGKKGIELLFNKLDGIFRFEELSFGDYCFEMFDTAEEYIADELLTNINEIKSGNLTVITANNIKRKCRLYEGGFDLNDDDDSFGKPGFEKAIRKIQKPFLKIQMINNLLKKHLQ